jgi:hypothetical protein
VTSIVTKKQSRLIKLAEEANKPWETPTGMTQRQYELLCNIWDKVAAVRDWSMPYKGVNCPAEVTITLTGAEAYELIHRLDAVLTNRDKTEDPEDLPFAPLPEKKQ